MRYSILINMLKDKRDEAMNFLKKNYRFAGRADHCKMVAHFMSQKFVDVVMS